LEDASSYSGAGNSLETSDHFHAASQGNDVIGDSFKEDIHESLRWVTNLSKTGNKITECTAIKRHRRWSAKTMQRNKPAWDLYKHHCHRALYLPQSPLPAAEPSICSRALYLWQSPLSVAEPSTCCRALYLRQSPLSQQSPLPAIEPSTCYRALYLQQSPLSAAEPSTCCRALYLLQSPLPGSHVVG